MGIEGRVALVTGSGGGIGEGIAREFAAAGARVIVNDLDVARAEAVAASLRSDGHDVMSACGSVADAKTVEEIVAKVLDRYGRIDILVNNVGIVRDASILKMPESDWDAVITVNLKSQFLCSKQVIPHMRSQGQGRIINITSRAWLGWFAQSSYSASKGGSVSLTRTQALEQARYGITVNCIAPGLIDTPMFRAMSPETIARLMEAQPTGTIGSSVDVAWGARFFADDDAGFISGLTLFICGGKSIFATPA